MKKQNYIYLVMKDGVEWGIPVQAFSKHKPAQKLADELNEGIKDSKDSFDRLSYHVVKKIKYNDG